MGRAEKKKRFTSEETASFCDQIAMLLNSGIPLYEGAYILAEEVEDKRTKQVLTHIEEQVRENMPLFEALSNTGAFPDYMVHMVKVGETTGKLEDVLKSLAAYYERDAQVKDGIRSAVAFPVILFAMMAVIMLVMVFKIIPLFEGMFLELSAEVASSTKRMMDGGILAGKIMAGITCALLLFMFAGLFIYRTAAGERAIKRLATLFGPFRRLSERMATGQFVCAAGLMAVSGMDQGEALLMAQEGCTNRTVKMRIEKCKEFVGAGESFDEALRHSSLIVGRDNRMIGVAMKSGAMDEMLSKLGKQYDEKVSQSFSAMSGRIETAMVLVLAAMVGTVLISVMLPLVGMISSIG